MEFAPPLAELFELSAAELKVFYNWLCQMFPRWKRGFVFTARISIATCYLIRDTVKKLERLGLPYGLRLFSLRHIQFELDFCFTAVFNCQERLQCLQSFIVDQSPCRNVLRSGDEYETAAWESNLHIISLRFPMLEEYGVVGWTEENGVYRFPWHKKRMREGEPQTLLPHAQLVSKHPKLQRLALSIPRMEGGNVREVLPLAECRRLTHLRLSDAFIMDEKDLEDLYIILKSLGDAENLEEFVMQGWVKFTDFLEADSNKRRNPKFRWRMEHALKVQRETMFRNTVRERVFEALGGSVRKNKCKVVLKWSFV
jgi:hypothetical protein